MAKQSAAKSEPEVEVEAPKGKRVVKQLRLMIDCDDERTIEEWMENIGKALSKHGHVTNTGANYLIIDRDKGTGLVCRPEDYDPEKRDFKDGRFPPPWAQTSAVQERIRRELGLANPNPGHLLTVNETIAMQRARDRDKDPNRDGRLSSSFAPRGSYSGGAVTTRKATPTVYDDDDELEFSVEDFKKTEDKAKVESESAAGDVAGAFKKRLRKKSSDK